MKVLYNTHYLGNFTRNHTTDIFCQILSNKPGAQLLIAVDMISNLTKCNNFLCNNVIGCSVKSCLESKSEEFLTTTKAEGLRVSIFSTDNFANANNTLLKLANC